MAKEEEENFNEDLELDDLDSLEKAALAELEDDKPEDNGENAEISKDDNIDVDDVDNDNPEDGENADADTEEQEEIGDKTEDNKEDKKEEATTDTFKPIEIEVGGHKITVNSDEELMAFVRKGVESANKPAETLTEEKEIISQGGLSKEDLQLLVDAKNGDKNAIAKLAQSGGIDLLDTDNTDADNYAPQFQPKIESDVDKVAKEIMSDEKLATDFRNVASTLPQDFVSMVTANANDLKIFAEHIKMGVAQEAIPSALKMKMLQGTSFAEAYVASAKEVLIARQNNGNTNSSNEGEKRTLTDKEKELRKKASDNGGGESAGGKKTLTPEDIANMSDEEFEKLTPQDLM